MAFSQATRRRHHKELDANLVYLFMCYALCCYSTRVLSIIDTSVCYSRVQHPPHPRHPHPSRGLKNNGFLDEWQLAVKIAENNNKIYNFNQNYIVSDLGQR